MNFNATLIGQSIFFLLFVIFCMKLVWPFVMRARSERKQQIADGLAAGERGKQDLELASKRATESLREAKQKAAEIISQGDKRGAELVEEAKAQAKAEADRLIAGAKAEMQQEVHRVREELRQSVADLAIKGAEKILRREIDANAHAELLSGIKQEL